MSKGRPGLIQSAKLNIRLQVSIAEALKLKAEEQGITLSEFFRAVAEREVAEAEKSVSQ